MMAKKTSLLLIISVKTGSLLPLSVRWSKSRLKRGDSNLTASNCSVHRELGEGWMRIYFIVIHLRVGCFLAKIFMHWVTSTSFVCHLFCRVDMCRAQFPLPRQNTSLSVSDLISISAFLFIYNMDYQHVFLAVLKKYFLYEYYITLSKTWHDLAKLHISMLLGLPEVGERSKTAEVYRERKGSFQWFLRPVWFSGVWTL